jgi:hypothetical protein
MAKISEKHKLVCKALLKYKFNQRKAYQEVYPKVSNETADVNCSRLLRDAKLGEYIATLIDKVDKKELVTVEKVIHGIKEVLERCMQHEPVMEYNHGTKKMEESGEYQFKENGALKALELLGKYKAMFTDKTEITGEDGEPISSHITIGFKEAKK